MLVKLSETSLFGLAPAEMPRSLSKETRVAVLSQILLTDNGQTSWQTFEQPYEGVVAGIEGEHEGFNIIPDEPLVDEHGFAETHPRLIDGIARQAWHVEYGKVLVRTVVAPLPEA